MKYLRKFWLLYLLTGAVFIGAVTWGSRTVTVLAESTPIARQNVLIIDAGHGGEDGGATSCSGALESQINLQIALRLDDLLHLLGYETVMIRTTDISVYTEGKTLGAKKVSDLKNRVKTVNETENGILISIHQNTFSDSKYSGAQVFYNNDAAKTLAQGLQSAFAATVNPGSNRQCKAATGVYLMQHIQKPGLLIECGFLSNPEEDARLRAGEYQQAICCVIAGTLSQMLSNT